MFAGSCHGTADAQKVRIISQLPVPRSQPCLSSPLGLGCTGAAGMSVLQPLPLHLSALWWGEALQLDWEHF